MKKFFSLFAAILFAGSMMAEQATIAKGTTNSYDNNTINGKATVKMGRSGAGGNMTITVGAGATSLSFYSAAWKNEGASVTITAPEGVTIAPDSYTVVATSELSGSGTSFTVANEENYKFTFALTGVTAETTFTLTSVKRCFVWDATYATGGTPVEPVVANFCKTEVGHFMAENADPNSYVLLSIGTKGGKTIVRIDQDSEKNTQMFDYLQVTGLKSVGEDVAEGGATAMAVEFDTPALVDDSLTLEILWSTTNWTGRWMVQNLRVAVADCQYATIPVTPITCAEVYSLADNAEAALNDVTVTYSSGANVWVKDASGALLIYLPKGVENTFKAGDVLAGVAGVKATYKGLVELKPSAEQVAAVVATAGEAPAPVELTVIDAEKDMSKLVLLKDVQADGAFVEGTASNLTITLGENTYTLRNNFKNAYTFNADEKYNVTAIVTYFDALQLYFISAEEIIVPALNIMAYGLKAGDVADNKVTIDYKLNAKATAVEIQLLDAEGAVKKSFDATGLKKGANQEVLDLEGVAAGTYNWAVKATAKPNNAAEPIQVATAGSGSAMGRAVTIDNSYESPYYGNIYQTCGLGVGLYGFDAALNPLFNGQPVAKNGWTATSNSSPCAATVGEDGLVYINDWSDSKPNVRIFNPATPEADAKDVFGGTASGTKGHMVNEAGDTIHASMRYCYPKGTGENTVLYTVDEDYKPGDVTHVFTYNIGTAETPWTSKPSGEGFTHAMTGGKWAGTVDNITFVPSKQEGGWWIAQHRYTDGAAVPALMHIAGDTLNYYSTGEFANATVGYNNQGDFAINHEQSIIVTATNNTKFNILVWDVEWNDNIPSVKAKYTVPSGFNAACLGLGLDDAGNIYASAPNKPVTIWALPKAENSCVTPAAKASKIVVTDTGTAIDNNFKPVQVQKVIVDGQVVIIKDGKTYNVMGQIVR